MKRNAITTTAGTTTTAITFAADHITVLGQLMPATYSMARSGDVYVFATVDVIAEPNGPVVKTPIRVHVTPDMPGYREARDAYAAYEAAAAGRKPYDDGPAAKAQPKAERPAKAPAAKAQPKAGKHAKAAPAAPAQPKAERPAKAPAAKAPAAKAQPKAERPAKAPAAKAQPKAERVAERKWVGTRITGNGWAIAFDEGLQRTVVTCKAPSATQRAAIEAAGFYWSPKIGGWVKKLTCKAYRAAQELAEKLGA